MKTRYQRILKQAIVMMFALCLYSSVCNAKTIRAFIGIETPISFHPEDCADGIMADHLNQIFDTLFWINYEGDIVPSLATEWRRIDDYTIQLKLRQNVKFQNGEPFDSNSVKYTFNRFIDPSNKVSNRFYGETILKTKIIDDHTVNIISRIPDSLLIYRLAVVGLMLPPNYHKQVGKEYFSKHPIGTGPFKFFESVPSERLVLLANKDYWGGKPSVDRLEIISFTSIDDAVKALLNRQLDFVAHIPGRYSEQILLNNNLTLQKKLTRQSIVLLINTKKDGPLRSLEFRKALRSGLNFSDVIKYGHNGNGLASHSLTVKGEPFHNELLKPFPYFPDKTRYYIKKHSIHDYQFKMLATKPYDLAGQIIFQQMRSLGLNVDIEYGSDEDEINEVLAKNQKGLIPEIDFLVTYCAHRFAIGAFPLLILLHSKGNWSITSDLELDRLLDAAISEFNFEEQKKKFKEVNKYIYENALVLPGFQHQDLFGVTREVKFKPHITGYVYFKDIKVK